MNKRFIYYFILIFFLMPLWGNSQPANPPSSKNKSTETIQRSPDSLSILKTEIAPLDNKNTADPSKPGNISLVKKVFNKDTTKNDAGLGDYLIVEVSNLKLLNDSAEAHNVPIILYVDNRPIHGLKPDFIDIENNKLTYYLVRNKLANESWDPLFRKPNPFKTHKLIPISVGLENKTSIPTNVKDLNGFSFCVIPPWRLMLALVGIVLVIGVIFWLAKYKGMLCERYPIANKPAQVPYSLALCQMAYWFAIIVIFYLTLFLLLFEFPTPTSTVLILIGISSGTAVGASILNSVNQNQPIEILNKLTSEFQMITDRIVEIDHLANANPQPLNIAELLKEKETKIARINEINLIKSQSTFIYTPKKSKGFFYDLVTDADGSIAFNRFQIVTWTVILSFIFVYDTWKDLSMPEFDSTLLGLMGISSGTYLGFKMSGNGKSTS